MPKVAKNPQKDLVSLIKLARKNGLRRIKAGDIELEFHDEVKPSPKTKPVMSNVADLLSDGIKVPGDDEMLYASTPYYDELVAQRTGNIPPAGGPSEQN